MAQVAFKLRKDAEQNRTKILEAARSLFAARGVNAPLEDVAAAAGVGIATLYRRFPDRQALLAALFVDEFEIYDTAAEAALACDDPWQGFRTYLERLCESQAAEEGLREAFTQALPGDRELEARRTRLRGKMQRIIERAQAQGTLRADVNAEDLAFVMWANASVVAATAQVVPDAWRRLFDLLLDGFRAECAHELTQPPLTQRQLFRSMLKRQRPRANRR